MIERLIDLLLDESKWPAAAVVAACGSVAWWLLLQRRRGVPRRLMTLGAMNLFYGCLIGVLGIGHLQGVTIMAVQGTLTAPWPAVYPLGVALAVPAWWLVASVGPLVRDEGASRSRVLALNVAIAGALLAAGPITNLPLVAPCVLNTMYQFHTRPLTGRAIATVTAVAYLLLLVGTLLFAAEGVPFEELRGMG